MSESGKPRTSGRGAVTLVLRIDKPLQISDNKRGNQGLAP